LAELRFKDYDKLRKRLQLINSTIEEFCTGLPHDEPIHIQGELRNAIDRCFTKTSVPDIIAALKAEEGETREWAQKTLATLHQRSPTAVYVTLRQMQLGKNWSISETFVREHQIAAKFMAHPDFTEGVHALLIRKDGKPAWKPASLEDINPKDNIADDFFRVAEGSQQLKLLNQSDYKEYRHGEYSIPSEAAIQSVVSKGELSQRSVVKHFVQQRRGKQGVKEIVQEVIDRKTKKGENGKAVWITEEAPVN
jgi:3-hydroxyisobutyryl-CoA hydrolase